MHRGLTDCQTIRAATFSICTSATGFTTSALSTGPTVSTKNTFYRMTSALFAFEYKRLSSMVFFCFHIAYATSYGDIVNAPTTATSVLPLT